MRAAEQWCASAGCSAAEISVVNLRTETVSDSTPCLVTRKERPRSLVCRYCPATS